MIVGCPKEVKEQEFRVGMTPATVAELVKNGHEVLVEMNAGVGSGFSDVDYSSAGATICAADDVWANSDMIVKVKEPKLFETNLMTPNQIIFTYLHLAAEQNLTAALQAKNVVAIAYETITDAKGTLPLLAPMSEVAGRLAPQVGSWAMQKVNGGCGKLLGGVPGVEPAKVLVIGGGMVGTNAAVVAAGMGADVTVIDRSIDRMRHLDDVYRGVFKTAFADSQTTERLAIDADMVVGAVLIPGAAAPKLLSEDQIKQMKSGSVLVDVAIDQGGCFETSQVTTHADPIFVKHGVVHYCVGNMPGAVARTSTQALNNATLPFILQLANKGAKIALEDNPHLMNGLNVAQGKITYKAVADAFGKQYTPAKDVL
jgi:alanine dehydrogenase